MLLALTSAALAEGVGVAALLPLISLVIDSEGDGGAFEFYIEQFFALVGLEVSLAGLLALIVVAMDQRLTFIRTLLEARWMYFVDRRSGDLASAVSVEPTRASTAYVPSCRVLSGGIQFLIYLVLSVTISWEVSVVALVISAVGMVALNRRGRENQTELQKSFMTRLLQRLDGIKTLKAMAANEVWGR
ncbi:MAG: hypothetical protein OXE76_03605 [Alphaproteobacteria bacterium]|nr:hypothetical protein [Rhodospirillaceae bacterium]MCY4318276.1 hypothetical protein [Alphaproteobacteria bacterium]